MPDLKDDVLAALGKVAGPDGSPCRRAENSPKSSPATTARCFSRSRSMPRRSNNGKTCATRAEAAVRAVPGVTSVMIALTAERAGGGGAAPRAADAATGGSAARAGTAPGAPSAPSPAGIPGVGAIIAVASGKGGVGKSTTAVNLALGLRDLGLKVGILDADIYGPSMPKLLAIRERPQTVGGNRLKPIERHGMPVMSIGFLIEEETPMIWRGPMVMSALTQMLREVEWGTSTSWWSTCRRAPATRNSPWRSRCRSKARSSFRRRRIWL